LDTSSPTLYAAHCLSSTSTQHYCLVCPCLHNWPTTQPAPPKPFVLRISPKGPPRRPSLTCDPGTAAGTTIETQLAGTYTGLRPSPSIRARPCFPRPPPLRLRSLRQRRLCTRKPVDCVWHKLAVAWAGFHHWAGGLRRRRRAAWVPACRAAITRMATRRSAARRSIAVWRKTARSYDASVRSCC